MPLRFFATLLILLVGWGGSALADQDEDFGGLPPGEGREAVFNTCQACHSLAIVKQQGLSRKSWDETLDWMIEEQGMPEPEPEEREQLLTYLSGTFGIDRDGGQ